MQSTPTTVNQAARSASVVPVHPEATRAGGATDAPPRPDLYAFVHKGLRTFLSDTLNRCGRMDVNDEADTTETLAQVRALVELCRAHLNKEEDYMHRAIEARRAGGARKTKDDHAGHLQAFEDIEADVRAVEKSNAPARAATAKRLYRYLALFVAENLEHMQVEETENNEVLWALSLIHI